MKIKDYHSKVIGRLIEYYRKRANLSRKEICDKVSNVSLSTIQRAEEGKYISSDKLSGVLKIFELKISESINKYRILDAYINKTYLIINSGKSLTEYASLKKEIKTFYNENIDCIYLKEMSSLCIETINIYMTSKIDNKDSINTCTYIYESLKGNNEAFLLDSYLLNMYNIYYSIEEYSSFYDYGKPLKESRLFYLDKCYYDAGNSNIFDLSKKYSENNLENSNNVYKALCFYVSNAFLYSYGGDYIKAQENTLKAKDFYEKNKEIIPVRFKYHIYENLSFIKFYSQEYDDCLKYSLYIHENYSHIMDYSYLVLFRSCEKTLNFKTLKKILKEKPKNNKKFVHIAFEYYTAKHIKKLDCKELQKMILEASKNSNTNSLFLYNFFLDEMMELCDMSRSYKGLYDYMKENQINLNSKGVLI